MDIGGFDIEVKVRVTNQVIGKIWTTIAEAWPVAVIQEMNNKPTFLRPETIPQGHYFIYEDIHVYNVIKENGVIPETEDRLLHIEWTFGEDSFTLVVGSENNQIHKRLQSCLDKLK